jgi:uncharacterized protein YggU (UPF0235/DUF167 family)
MPRTPDGCRIEARVTPRSSRSSIELTTEGSLKIWTSSAPTDGQANASVCILVAKALGIANSRVRIVRGDTSRTKILAIEGLRIEEVLSRLRAG